MTLRPVVALMLALGPLTPLALAQSLEGLVAAARARTVRHEVYDSTYRVIGYPMGDVFIDS
jgi:uncharacterized protein YijF (DUF1287 family)